MVERHRETDVLQRAPLKQVIRVRGRPVHVPQHAVTVPRPVPRRVMIPIRPQVTDVPLHVQCKRDIHVQALLPVCVLRCAVTAPSPEAKAVIPEEADRRLPATVIARLHRAVIPKSIRLLLRNVMTVRRITFLQNDVHLPVKRLVVETALCRRPTVTGKRKHVNSYSTPLVRRVVL